MTPEEALIHAYTADIARLPPDLQPIFNPKRLAEARMSGKPTVASDRFDYYMAVGHPDYKPQDDEERDLQNQLLSGYSGRGWTPSQRESLGKHPEPYALSPGGKYLDQLESRERLYKSFTPQKQEGWFPSPAAWAGKSKAPPPTEGAAKLYARDIGRDYAYLSGTGPGTWVPGIPEGGLKELQNPENTLGSMVTKLNGVVSDGASLLGTALLRGTDPTAALGDTAVRYHGADFHRTNPALAQDNGWRENDSLIEQGRGAHADSEGMQAGDTFRAAIGNHILPKSWNGQIPYLQPLINAGISVGNGLLDGTGALTSTKAIANPVRAVSNAVAKTRVPGVSQFARSTSNEISKTLTTKPTFAGRVAANAADESIDPGTVPLLGFEFLKNDQRDRSQFDADQKTAEATRQQSIKQLENLNSQIVRPPTAVSAIGNAVAPVAGKATGWLHGLLSK